MTANQKLRAALQRILDGEAKYTNGKLTHSSLTKEAGVSRAQYYREVELHAEVSAIIEAGGDTTKTASPITIQDKNRELQSANTELKRKVSKVKKESEKELAQARQKIYILNRLIEKRDEQLAKVKKDLANCKKSSNNGLRVVK